MAKRGPRDGDYVPLPDPAWIVKAPFYPSPRPAGDQHQEWVIRVRQTAGRSRYYRTHTHLHRWLAVKIATPPDAYAVEVGYFLAGEWRGTVTPAWPDTFRPALKTSDMKSHAVKDMEPLSPEDNPQPLFTGVWS